MVNQQRLKGATYVLREIYGHSFNEIAYILNHSKSTINYNYLNDNRNTKKFSGKITHDMSTRIRNLLSWDCSLSLRRLKGYIYDEFNVKVSVTTMRKELKNLGMKSVISTTKTFLTQDNKNER